MPTYEYRCQNCHHELDAFQRMSDPPLTKCPHCGHDTLQRVVTGGAGVIYKGEGWYVTDYSKKASGGKESSATTSAAKVSEPAAAAPKSDTASPKPSAPASTPSSSSRE